MMKINLNIIFLFRYIAEGMESNSDEFILGFESNSPDLSEIEEDAASTKRSQTQMIGVLNAQLRYFFVIVVFLVMKVLIFPDWTLELITIQFKFMQTQNLNPVKILIE